MFLQSVSAFKADFCFYCEILCHKKTSNEDVCEALIFFYFPTFFFTDSKSQCFKRHTLNYLQEIGNGWFGKVRQSPPIFGYNIIFDCLVMACSALLYLILTPNQITCPNSK